jgi:hypothetical protein
LDELSAEFDKKLDIGEAESVAKYVEEQLKTIDVSGQLENYVTNSSLNATLKEKIGELVSEEGDPVSVKTYIE